MCVLALKNTYESSDAYLFFSIIIIFFPSNFPIILW